MTVLLPGRSYLIREEGEIAPLLAEFSLFDQITVDANELDVKILREKMATLQLAATEKRVFLISNAEKLSEVLQNTLLKLLEEPPSTLVIALQTNQPQRLMPTVQSRLHKASFGRQGIRAELGSESALAGSAKQVFDAFSKLTREELTNRLVSELQLQRSMLLNSTNLAAGRRIEILDLAVKKLAANSNQKLTLDWLLLHWSSD